MGGLDHDAAAYSSGFVTPPLSPSKSISTEDWTSPRTPVSPRKTRSCLVFRDEDQDSDRLVLPPSNSPTKPKSKHASRIGALSIPEIFTASIEPSPTDSPTKKQVVFLDGGFQPDSIRLNCTNNHSAPNAHITSTLNDEITAPTNSLPALNIEQNSNSSNDTRRNDNHSSKDSVGTNRRSLSSPRPISSNSASDNPQNTVPSLSVPNKAEESCTSSNTLQKLPLRASASPLRPSQWVTRGGLLASPRHHTQTTDRFIPLHRPASVTRESYELNKPSERRNTEDKVLRDGMSSPDPFSGRIRRSGRLNDELRHLRQAHHSSITSRANLNRGGATSRLRRGPWTLDRRQISAGAVWNVGGPYAVSDTVIGVSNGRGGLLGSGTNAPLYTSMFLDRADPEAELEAYEQRLALALDVDPRTRILKHSSPNSVSYFAGSSSGPSTSSSAKYVWKDNAWSRESVMTLLDAPHLRDDYYCSLLAYSHSAKVLAVGLGNFVHLWSERKGVDTPESLNSLSTSSATPDALQHVTSLSFSSLPGGKAILAVGRADGRITLWSPFDSEPRFDATQPKPISCVSFRPDTVRRPSVRDAALDVRTEELLIGDEVGHIYFYSVEWPSETESALFGWHGAMTLLARMTIHTQQICGLAWSPNGEMFATGGNDNQCFLFETKRVLRTHNHRHGRNTASEATTDNGASIAEDSSGRGVTTTLDVRHGLAGETIYTVLPGRGSVLNVTAALAKHTFQLSAAIKAIAFSPVSYSPTSTTSSILAIGGGSNDRCIHFYHTISGSCLATIDCAAQVTSLIWSNTRREICATFGFAQPEHPYRIAVFEWPSCRQVCSVPWYDENRALYAVAYPGGPGITLPEGPSASETSSDGRARGEDAPWSARAANDGCIVVAASDMAIRFHEIWTGGGNRVGLGGLGGTIGDGVGLLGGSHILEDMHGIVRGEESIIR